MRGEDDFFSVARTMPLVAARIYISGTQGVSHSERLFTFDPEGSDSLVYRVEGIFWLWDQLTVLFRQHRS